MLPQYFSHISFKQPGNPDVLSLSMSPLPKPIDEQVLIKVSAAGVNGPDIAQRQGIYPAPISASPILGLEVSGVIVAIGEQVSHWKIGDKVCALLPGGGYGEYVLTQSSHCLPIPKGFSDIEAAVLPETMFTVWGNLFDRGELQAGETVLIHGASGGLGNCAISLAKAFGATVITTSGSEDKQQHCLGLGADHAFNYHDPELLEQINQVTNHQGVDLIFDMAAGDFVNLNLKLLAEDGRLVTVALKRGAKANVDVFRLMAKRITWTGSTLRPQSDAAKANIANRLLQSVWPLLEQNKFRPHIHQTFKLTDAKKAHELLESGQHRGKVVLKICSL
ncbi:NAD(P)H-quinone oxidoreductase [Parashewanella spongiae]|uniref:NAD(P)H-quinone oxidoreductase n=1 Tax=Parashewanella spongiae TaxID=342950 RepID=A0A3A6TIS7_9GAMM|nr:NAD(P)H-quinone oxidoreductase [Parashewanella spongiae]MCL1079723.1 NAD(P)H-quinone oxidoreductase [Parashewanella spongiae]RJY06998.1 NAD(P)H-quinone oxidoreductase [Parashewanella spongiae]